MTQSITNLCRDRLLTGGFWHCHKGHCFPKSTVCFPNLPWPDTKDSLGKRSHLAKKSRPLWEKSVA